MDLRGRKIVGAEALVRWQHPRGLVPPMQFIPFAEQTGFVRQLTAWVLAETAPSRAAPWTPATSFACRSTSPPATCSTRTCPPRSKACSHRSALRRQTLCLEITESAIMDDPERALSTLEHLSAQGFKLSIDDFGTGYSSLAYLKRLPVDELKIDKSFVLAMERDLDDARIVRSTVELAHNLGLSVVAEGLRPSRPGACSRPSGATKARTTSSPSPCRRPVPRLGPGLEAAPPSSTNQARGLLGWLG